MNRVYTSIDKSTAVDGLISPITLAAGVAQDVLPSVKSVPSEYAGRWIENEGANPTFYAIGQDCSPNNHNGTIYPGQQFDTAPHADRISCYSVLGTILALTSTRRNDFAKRQNILSLAPNAGEQAGNVG